MLIMRMGKWSHPREALWVSLPPIMMLLMMLKPEATMADYSINTFAAIIYMFLSKLNACKIKC